MSENNIILEKIQEIAAKGRLIKTFMLTIVCAVLGVAAFGIFACFSQLVFDVEILEACARIGLVVGGITGGLIGYFGE